MRSNSIYVSRDPFREFDALVRSAFGGGLSAPGAEAFSPAAESHREGDDALIRLELPGLDLSTDIAVEVKGRELVISGERRDERREDTDRRHLAEFRYGAFRRAFRLAPSVTADDVTASYDAGVLTVRVANAYAETQGHRIAIATGPAQVAAGETVSGEVES
ncbi:MAG: Hsp20/alpha crystallin family protein [Nocardioides sp.]